MSAAEFRKHVDDIDRQVRDLFIRVIWTISSANAALRDGDQQKSRRLVAEDVMANGVVASVERVVERELATKSPVGSDLRFLLTVLRIAPELERSADLAVHIAERAGIAQAFPAFTARQLAAMAETVEGMWRMASDAWCDRDPDAVRVLRIRDERLNLARDQLVEAVLTSGLESEPAMACVLLGRFYERLGDHAVHIAEKTRWCAGRAQSTRVHALT